MTSDSDVQDLAFNILERFNRENLLKDADPFTLKYLREEIERLVERWLALSPDTYDIGYDEGYAAGKERGFEDGTRDVVAKASDFFEDDEALSKKIDAFLEDLYG